MNETRAESEHTTARFSRALPRRLWDVPWRVRDALKTIFFSALIAFGFQVIVAALIGVGFAIDRLGPPDRQWFLSVFTTSPWSDYWYLIYSLLTLLFLSVFILRPWSVRLRDFFSPDRTAQQGQGKDTPTGRLVADVRDASQLFLVALLLTLMGVGVIVAVVWVTASPLAHHEPMAAVSTYFQGRAQESAILLRPDMSWFRVVIIVLCGPSLEEVVFRGCLYAALRKRVVAWRANLLSSLLFAALHLYAFNFPNVLLIGMLAAYAYERTRSLRVPIAFHMLWNLFGVASVKPWLWLVLASGGLILWLRYQKHPSAQDRRTGWKIFAVLLPIITLFTYEVDSSSMGPLLVDIPLLVAVALYAWKRSTGPRIFWLMYGIGYPVWIAAVLWASTIPEVARLPWQHAIALSEPIKGMSDLMTEVADTLIIEGPALLVVWRLALSRGIRGTENPVDTPLSLRYG